MVNILFNQDIFGLDHGIQVRMTDFGKPCARHYLDTFTVDIGCMVNDDPWATLLLNRGVESVTCRNYMGDPKFDGLLLRGGPVTADDTAKPSMTDVSRSFQSANSSISPSSR